MNPECWLATPRGVFILKMSLAKTKLSTYTANQLNVFFPDPQPVRADFLASHIDQTLERVEYCFSFVNNRYYFDGKNVLFNHLNADQYAMFLYILSNELYNKHCDAGICDKIFYLNKILHGIDVFYEVKLPDIFLFVHPLGTVLGRGTYADFFLVYQQCGIGSNNDVYPTLGKYVSLHPGSSILGNCTVGENCKIATGSLLLDYYLETDSVYIGDSLNFTIKKSRKKLNIWKQRFR